MLIPQRLSAGLTLCRIEKDHHFITSHKAQNLARPLVQKFRIEVIGPQPVGFRLERQTERSTSVLFGDGAGAVVVRAEEGEPGLLSVAMHSDGSLGHLIDRPVGGSRHPVKSLKSLDSDSDLGYIRMRGNETFRVAVRSLAEVSHEVLADYGVSPSDVDWFIPHQANRRIIDAVGQRLAIPEGRTYINVERYGNTSSASIPIALDELNRSGKLEPGHLVLLSAFGSGLTWGASLIRW